MRLQKVQIEDPKRDRNWRPQTGTPKETTIATGTQSWAPVEDVTGRGYADLEPQLGTPIREPGTTNHPVDPKTSFWGPWKERFWPKTSQFDGLS